MRKYFYFAVLLAAVQLTMTYTLFAQSVTGWQLTGNRNADTTSFVGTTNGIPLRLATKNAARMVIDTLGNVGIGNLKPKYTLDITGKLRLADGTQGAGKVLTSDATGLVSWLTPVSSPWTISGNNLYNINTGNIGIGTTTPKAKLDVNADALINGVKIGKGNNSANSNTMLGALALDSNTTGVNNSGIGYAALSLNKTGYNNTAIGTYALSKNTSGISNTATGTGALRYNTIGNYNTANGLDALSSNTTGSGNTAVGDSVLAKTAITISNTAIGHKAMLNNVTGSYNTAVGQQALQYVKSGTYNTALGYLAGTSGVDSAILTNATAIGANAKVTTNNSMVLGFNVNVGIGVSAPTARLHVKGLVKIDDGTQALNRVLTCDATGLANWKIAPGSLWTSTGNDSYLTLPGKLGIGTNTSPNAKVEINNTLKFTNTSANADDGVIGTAPFQPGLNIVGINTDATNRKINYWGSLIQNENLSGNTFIGTTNLPGGIWNNNGYVGLGTTAPNQRLDIKGNLHFSNADLPKGFSDELGGTTPLFTMGLNFHETGINQVYRGGAYRIDSRDGFPIHNWFARSANSNAENVVMALGENGGLRVGSTFTSFAAPDNGAIIQGNVGIGKTSPQWNLHVIGDIMADGGYLRVSGDKGIYWQDYGGGFFMNDNTWMRTYSDKNIWTGSGLLGSQGGLTIGSGGATPSYGGASIAGYTTIGGGANITGSVTVTGGALISGGYITLCNSLDNSQGNVGIGSGGYSNVKLRVNTDEQFGIYVDGGACAKPGGGNWSATSDKRLKKDIKTYSDGLAALLKIRPVTYHYNELSGFNMDKEYVGVLAQELKEFAPYMVSLDSFKNTGKQYYSVDNSAMTYMLINSVKELKGQVDVKDETITKQQADIKTLQQQMNMLLQKVNAMDARQEACCNMTQQTKVVDNEHSVALTSASLDQNVPNPPVNHATRIGYNVPKGAGKAEMIITDNFGKKLKTINLSVMGKGFMNVDTGGLAPGTYSYTLIVDGKMIDTKQMVVGSN